MNKSYPITGFIYSWMRRIRSSPLHTPHLDVRPLGKQCPSKVISFSPVIHIARGFSGVTRSPLEEKYKQRDKIPDNFNLIYRNPMYIYISLTQCVTSGSSLLLLLSCGYNYFTSNVWKIDIEFLTFGSLLLVLNFSASYLIMQHIMRIYVSDGKYICMMPSLVPFRLYKLTYSAGDVKHVPPKGFLPWRFNRYKIHQNSAIILENYFRKPEDYNTMISRNDDR